MIAAGDDPNIKVVVLVMPLLSGRADAANFIPGSLADAWAERKETCLGPSDKPRKYIQVWDNNKAEAEGQRGSTLLHGSIPYAFIEGGKKLSDAAGTPWQNRLSTQSLYYISRCEPEDFLSKISPKPLLHLAASEDPLSGPPELQKQAFENAGEPKEFVLLQNNHIANYFEGFESNVGAQISFLKKYS